ncbi:MAG TPA: DUF952 domain-containing protein [Pyrinomonadaceae bacterium]|nr:DUF952 domain-containing protein [Pyrinomonadaceae bacterium]
MAIIFHIARSEAWANRERLAGAGSYRPEMFPVDGFVHCSTEDQVLKVADIRFRGQKGLVLLCIDTDKVTAEIRYENLEGGQELFPHIYGEINADAVVEVAEFQPGADGYFTLPAVLAVQKT